MSNSDVINFQCGAYNINALLSYDKNCIYANIPGIDQKQLESAEILIRHYINKKYDEIWNSKKNLEWYKKDLVINGNTLKYDCSKYADSGTSDFNPQFSKAFFQLSEKNKDGDILYKDSVNEIRLSDLFMANPNSSGNNFIQLNLKNNKDNFKNTLIALTKIVVQKTLLSSSLKNQNVVISNIIKDSDIKNTDNKKHNHTFSRENNLSKAYSAAVYSLLKSKCTYINNTLLNFESFQVFCKNLKNILNSQSKAQYKSLALNNGNILEYIWCDLTGNNKSVIVATASPSGCINPGEVIRHNLKNELKKDASLVISYSGPIAGVKKL